jgi:hypothetical protein
VIDRYPLGVRFTRGVIAGGAFGAATSLVNNVPIMLGEVGQAHTEDSAATWTAIFVSLILDSGWAWAALAFGLGWFSGTPARPATAALTGAAGLIIATIAFYSMDALFGAGLYWPAVGYWMVRAVVFGLPLGAAGALARRPGPVGLLAGLIVPAGAAANMVVLPVRQGLPGESSAAAWAESTVWVAVAIGTVLVVLRFVRGSARGRRPSDVPVARMTD